MKLSKEKCKDRGYIVYMTIGKVTQKSWWSSPPDNIDHVDKGYLQDRGYYKITTEERLKEFKDQWKELFKNKYLILCTRHESIYGDNWCLWWGCRESKSSYSSDVRDAHRFTYDEAIEIADNKGEYMVSCEELGISEDYEPKETLNKNIRLLIEKGTINEICEFELRRD
ncbi:hypothetical protein [Clostridium beijerinckii]|uniref:hypothetical protein n=1 Tax=Clostridium beijerinckii TaxID=1520 RepID=UPI001F44E06D|nr:hypothetical protein [Clostridium beijerinckii]